MNTLRIHLRLHALPCTVQAVVRQLHVVQLLPGALCAAAIDVGAGPDPEPWAPSQLRFCHLEEVRGLCSRAMTSSIRNIATSSIAIWRRERFHKP